MDNQDFFQKMESIEAERVKAIKLLLDEYAIENHLYQVGEFIGNVTGIIKVESYWATYRRGLVEIHYEGHRYKRTPEGLVRTKDKSKTDFLESLVKPIKCKSQ